MHIQVCLISSHDILYITRCSRILSRLTVVDHNNVVLNILHILFDEYAIDIVSL